MINEEIIKKYLPTIGIECHVQLATNTKLFSGTDNDERDKSPNSVVSPIDYALPGMLPILNRAAVDLAIKAGKALNAKVANISRFDRKHYFYPDLPKGYQTTQMYFPIIGPGSVKVPLPDGTSFDVKINHAHMEEDAGKLTHFSNFSLVDLNRAGTPLIEIVSEPDMHSAIEAKAFATELYHLMTLSGVTRGDLFHGNMRFDVNVSVALNNTDKLGKRAEVKNLNSFRSVERAVEYEIKRQIEIIENGGVVIQETRGWDDAKQKTISQRSKEDAQDYRYMPDADIPPIVLSDDEINNIQSTMPKLSNDWRIILQKIGLDYSQIETLLDAEFIYHKKINFLDQIELFINNGEIEKAKFLSNWHINVFIPLLQDDSFEFGEIDYLKLEDIIYQLVQENKLSSTNAKIIFRELISLDTMPNIEEYATQKGYIQNSNEDEVSGIVDEALSDISSTKAVEDFKNGNEKVIGYLVGQVMRKSAGKANPELVQKIIRERLK